MPILNKIRRVLLAQNRFTKYMLYAVGEIVLVVVGILIALNINNWNEGRRALDKERATLTNLHTEFGENYKELDSINNILLHTIKATEEIFDMVELEPNQDSRTVDSLLQLIIVSPSWKPSEFVLNDLKSSDGLTKLNNTELKILLFHWSRFFNELQETMAQVESTNDDLIGFIKRNGSLRNLDVQAETFDFRRSKLSKDNVALLKDYQFENFIDDKLYVLIEAKNEYANAKVLIEKILRASEIEEVE